jgi:hypothetical protein
MHSSIPILLTSAVRVSAQHTALRDADERLRLTLDSIARWRQTPGIRAVVVCDGSGFDLSPLLPEGPAGAAPVECLSFQNDIVAVRRQGKGFGEGQIVAHALQHSLHLKQAQVWAKCTAKLWVQNFADCLAGYQGPAAFDIRGFSQVRSVDSRFYLVDSAFHAQHLAHVHEQVDDDHGWYLEHCLLQALEVLPIQRYVMVPPPRVVGVSGSDGQLHAPGWHWRLFWQLRNRAWRLLGRHPAQITRSGRRPGSPPA